jgi:hypothetical protein
VENYPAIKPLPFFAGFFRSFFLQDAVIKQNLKVSINKKNNGLRKLYCPRLLTNIGDDKCFVLLAVDKIRKTHYFANIAENQCRKTPPLLRKARCPRKLRKPDCHITPNGV